MIVFDVDSRSKAIHALGWNPDDNSCFLMYKNKQVIYHYQNVPDDMVTQALLGHESIGQTATKLKNQCPKPNKGKLVEILNKKIFIDFKNNNVEIESFPFVDGAKIEIKMPFKEFYDQFYNKKIDLNELFSQESSIHSTSSSNSFCW
jgi:hypothetical protein